MAFHVRDAATDIAVRRLAKLKGKTLTDMIERLKPIQDQFAALRKPGGLPADKAFFDELSGDV